MRVLRTALLVVTALALAVVAQARKAEDPHQLHRGFRLRLDLIGQARGYQLSSEEQGLDYLQMWLEEGARLGLTGFVFNPGILSFELRSELFAQQMIQDREWAPGYRYGLGARVTLLPGTRFPLTLQAERTSNGIGSAALPGAVIDSDILGLMWATRLSGLPNVNLQLMRVDNHLSRTIDAPAALTGQTTDEPRRDLYYLGRLELRHDAALAHARARYDLQARDQEASQSWLGEVEHMSLRQQVDLDASVRLAERLTYHVLAAGLMVDDPRLDSGLQSYRLQSFMRYQPDDKLRGQVAYGFGSSGGLRDQHQITADAEWRARPHLALRTRVFSSLVTTSSELAPSYQAREGVGLGGYLERQLGSLSLRVEDMLTVGSTQLAGLQGGFLLGNQLVGTASFGLSRTQLLTLMAMAGTNVDTSAIGTRTDLLHLYSVLTSLWSSSVTTELRGRASASGSQSVMQLGPLEQQKQLSLEAYVRVMVTGQLSLNLGAGVDDSVSTLSQGHRQGGMVSGQVMFSPLDGLLLQGTTLWRLESMNGQLDHWGEARASVAWMIQRFMISADYTYRRQGNLGQPSNGHYLFARVQRSFDLGF